jgi:hypothetical protein
MTANGDAGFHNLGCDQVNPGRRHGSIPLGEASLLELVDELAALARACGQRRSAARLQDCARSFRAAPRRTRDAIVEARAQVLAIPGLLLMCEAGIPHEGDQSRAVALADQLWIGVHTVGAGGV